MLPVSTIIPIVGVSLFASSFLYLSEKAPDFQSAFERASVVDAPKAELSDFSEYPGSRQEVVAELKVRNAEMRKCVDRKRCVFLMVYSKLLLDRLKTLDEGTDPLEPLKRKYGKFAYEYVKENKDAVELKYDERFTAWILRKTGGKMLSVDNGFTKEEVKRIYEEYVVNEALPELSEDIRKSKSRKMKAFYAYGIQYLLSDVRLESPMK